LLFASCPLRARGLSLIVQMDLLFIGYYLLALDQMAVLPKIALAAGLSDLDKLLAGGIDNVLHGDGVGVLGGRECRIDDYVLYVASCYLEPAREEIIVHVRGYGRFSRHHALPYPAAVLLLREGKFDQEVHSPHEGIIDIGPQIAGQDDNPLMLLHLLQQIADFDVCIPVVRVLDLAPLAEESIRLVEEEHGIALFRLFEDPVQILLRLSDVLADDRGEVDLIEVYAQIPGHHLCCHRLSRPGGPYEKSIQASAQGELPLKAPVAVDQSPMPDMVSYIPELLDLICWQDDILPGVPGLDPPGQQGEGRL